MKLTNYVLPGIHINDKLQPFTAMILSGKKTIETRDNAKLDQYMGQRVGIIRTGKGKAMLVGFADIATVSISWKYPYQFRQYFKDHRVHAGSPYDMKPGRRKHGYFLQNVQKIDPIELPSETYTHDRTARELYDFCKEKGINVMKNK